MTDPTPFLVALASQPFAWGRTDCALVLADYLLWSGRNRDFAEDLRGTYADEATCVRLLRARGGLLRLVARLAREARLSRVTAPETGDIGVVRFRAPSGRLTHYGAIRAAGEVWAIKCHDGLLLTPAAPAAIWRL